MRSLSQRGSYAKRECLEGVSPEREVLKGHDLRWLRHILYTVSTTLLKVSSVVKHMSSLDRFVCESGKHIHDQISFCLRNLVIFHTDSHSLRCF